MLWNSILFDNKKRMKMKQNGRIKIFLIKKTGFKKEKKKYLKMERKNETYVKVKALSGLALARGFFTFSLCALPSMFSQSEIEKKSQLSKPLEQQL